MNREGAKAVVSIAALLVLVAAAWTAENPVTGGLITAVLVLKAAEVVAFWLMETPRVFVGTHGFDNDPIISTDGPPFAIGDLAVIHDGITDRHARVVAVHPADFYIGQTQTAEFKLVTHD